ncbi:hypothetical protein QGM71_14325 [Virgibacillus sp. C22-A2]|uniref:Uncharacterized protein n=1 Tax=Virgibacillus tibetensis TaxID=3042313 RepID=A0ABU6KHN1_9BACI|nr:hypothetical protein [Virgibacillus sp. C22-A2]
MDIFIIHFKQIPAAIAELSDSAGSELAAEDFQIDIAKDDYLNIRVILTDGDIANKSIRY